MHYNPIKNRITNNYITNVSLKDNEHPRRKAFCSPFVVDPTRHLS